MEQSSQSAPSPRLDFSAHPAQVADLWRKLPRTTWAYERPLTSKEERKGLRATWLKAKWHTDWTELPGVGLNAEKLVRYITIDCDHGDTDRWDLVGLRPSMIVYNHSNQRHHVTFELSAPVARGENARQRPQTLLSLITRALVRDLNGDPSYAGLTTKNPLCTSRFGVICPGGRPYSLQEMVAALDLDGVIEDEAANRRFGGREGLALAEQDDNSRNKRLFNTLRIEAYAEARSNLSYYRAGGQNSLQNLLMGWARQNNIGMLPSYELDAITKSIAKFCCNKLRPAANADGKNRGVMRLDRSLSLVDRQAAGGEYAAGLIRSRSVAMVRAAVSRMVQDRVALTQVAVAAVAGLSLRTVKTLWSMVKGIVSEMATAAFKAAVAVRSCSSLKVQDSELSDNPGAGRGASGEMLGQTQPVGVLTQVVEGASSLNLNLNPYLERSAATRMVKTHLKAHLKDLQQVLQGEARRRPARIVSMGAHSYAMLTKGQANAGHAALDSAQDNALLVASDAQFGDEGRNIAEADGTTAQNGGDLEPDCAIEPIFDAYNGRLVA